MSLRQVARIAVSLSSAILTILLSAVVEAQDAPPPKPVPAMQVEPLPHFQARFLHGDRELTRYHFDPADRRPFLFPLIGPAGRSLSRMGHPHDPVSHSHHNSFWVAHHIVNGVNFWGDAGPKLGRIVSQRIEQIDDADDGAWLIGVNHWIDESTREVLLVERRRVEVRTLAGGEYFVLLDLEFTPGKQPATFDRTPFGLVAVRMRKTIGVHDGGGRILNSEGAINEKGVGGAAGVFWKPARWCDYSGPVTTTASEGVTLFDHPSNPNHPTVFHVRDDGWMGSSLTFTAPRTLEVGAKLRLRYGLHVHADVPTREAIDTRWQEFTKFPVPATLEKPKPQPQPKK